MATVVAEVGVGWGCSVHPSALPHDDDGGVEICIKASPVLPAFFLSFLNPLLPAFLTGQQAAAFFGVVDLYLPQYMNFLCCKKLQKMTVVTIQMTLMLLDDLDLTGDECFLSMIYPYMT